MLKKKLILRDPLKFLGFDSEEDIDKSRTGAVVARAGVGKTAFLVQLAISALLKEKNVLHISVQDLVDKVNLWYLEMFQNIIKSFESEPSKKLWDELLTRRFIMTFEGESFEFGKLQKKICELKTQNIFNPHLIIFDGLSYNPSDFDELARFKNFIKSHSMSLWFCVRTNVPFESDPEELMKHLGKEFIELFDTFILMIPEKDRIQVKKYTLGNQVIADRPELFLDPSSMLIQENPSAVNNN
jgi:KaiC/GvpD/RAD55 family RecA-like ATPase